MSAEEYEVRFRLRPTATAREEGFPEDVAVNTNHGNPVLRTELIMNINFHIFANGRCEDATLMICGANGATSQHHMSLHQRAELRNNAMFEINSAAPSQFIHQFVEGKVSMHDASVWLWRLSRRVKELGIRREGESDVDQAARLALQARLQTHYVAQKARLLAHLDRLIDLVHRHQRPPCFQPSGSFELSEEQTAFHYRRQLAFLTRLRAETALPLFFEGQNIFNQAGLPPQKHYYKFLNSGSKMRFWARHFNTTIHQILYSIVGGIIDITATLENPTVLFLLTMASAVSPTSRFLETPKTSKPGVFSRCITRYWV